MVSYQKQQELLLKEIEKDFKEGKFPATIVEPVQDYSSDNRICLTSVVFLPQEIQRIVDEKVIKPLKELDKRQYYYLPQSLHITIQNIRTISDPPLFSKKDVEKVKNVLREVITRYEPFDFSIEGFFELPTSLSLCAYSDEILKQLVFEIRKSLKKVGVPDNKKYASDEIVIANSTICRYIGLPNDAFFEEVGKLKNIDVGRVQVKNVSLITTNSVCHPNKTSIVERYPLKAHL